MKLVHPRHHHESWDSMLILALVLAVLLAGLVVAKATARPVTATPEDRVVRIAGPTVAPSSAPAAPAASAALSGKDRPAMRGRSLPESLVKSRNALRE